ncbi:Chitinase domain-containing protein 1, partial [Trichinella pseudospiralis]
LIFYFSFVELISSMLLQHLQIYCTLIVASFSNTFFTDEFDRDNISLNELFKEEEDDYITLLETHGRMTFDGPKNFPNPVLAYVTPWNNHGYDIAKWLAPKFTFISPVWLHLVASQGKCSIAGSHDIDQKWISEVRSNNSAVKVVPRFLLQYKDKVTAEYLLSSELFQNICFRNVVEFIQRNGFEGAVLEVISQTVPILTDQKTQIVDLAPLLQMIINFAEYLRRQKKIVILVVPACTADADQPSLFNESHMQKLSPFIDYVSVMTYDYNRFGKVGINIAPLSWIERCIVMLINSNNNTAEKILMGINFYGYEFDYKVGELEPVIGSRYVEAVKSEKPKFVWDNMTNEHFAVFKWKVINFPNLKVIKAKLNLAIRLNVGVAIWDIGQGLDHFYELL